MSSTSHSATTIRARDGILLAARRWTPGFGSRGTIVLVHGLGEHLGRYEYVADALGRGGWTVAGYDQRGHGHSEGRRGVVPEASTLLDDLALVTDWAHEARSDDAPLVLLGHSLGGLVAAWFVLRGLRRVDGLVLTSPALAADLSILQRVQLHVGRVLVPDLPMPNGLKVSRISRDPEVVRAYREDPLVHDRITARLAWGALEAGHAVRAAAGAWTVPTLLLWAGDDHLVAAAGSEEFAQRAPRAIVTARRFDGLRHEILNEPERDDVLGAITRWLEGLRPRVTVPGTAS